MVDLNRQKKRNRSQSIFILNKIQNFTIIDKYFNLFYYF